MEWKYLNHINSRGSKISTQGLIVSYTSLAVLLIDHWPCNISSTAIDTEKLQEYIEHCKKYFYI